MSVRAAVAVATMFVAVKAVLMGLAARRWQAIAAGQPLTPHSMSDGWLIWSLVAAAGVVAAGALAVLCLRSQRRRR